MSRCAPSDWKYTSPARPGLHLVLSPENSPCRVTWMYRLNLPAGGCEELHWVDREASAGVIGGRVRVRAAGADEVLGKCDAFYLPGATRATVAAEEDAILYIGCGPWEGVGQFFVRRLDMDLPPGAIRQVHGKPPYRRDVFMNLDPGTPASRIISGFTWGDPGAWTSWPPHEHTKDLEEVYAYFDLPTPQFALHLSSRVPGTVEAVHPVSSGDFVAVPEGYHPTVAMPGVRSSYFWVMVAHSVASRRYDLAVTDPAFSGSHAVKDRPWPQTRQR